MLRSDPHSYFTWLNWHTDAQLEAFLRRAGSPSEFGTRPAATGPAPALSNLTSLELALLELSCDLAYPEWPELSPNTSFTVTELGAALTETLDALETQPECRPTSALVAASITRLIDHGLLFGPAVRINVSSPPTTLPGDDGVATPLAPETELTVCPYAASFLHADTTHVWRLHDINACPIPTSELPDALAALPPRLTRILRTLHRNDGVGYSNSLSPTFEPAGPLAPLLEAQILEQVTYTSVRVSGRVWQVLNRHIVAPPGGVFTVPSLARTAASQTARPAGPGASAAETAPPPDAAAVLNLITELSDALTDIAYHPIKPLRDGGIGSREITKVLRRRAQASGMGTTSPNGGANGAQARVADDIARLVRFGFLHLAEPLDAETVDAVLAGTTVAPSAAPLLPGPIGFTDDALWAVTTSGWRFLQSATPAAAWAQLLVGWATSRSQPSDTSAEAESATPSRGLVNTIVSDDAATHRKLFLASATELLHQSFDAAITSPEAWAHAWFFRPAAARTLPVDTWNSLAQEAEELGLFAQGMPTQVLLHLASPFRHGNLTEAGHLVVEGIIDILDSLLPDAAKYIIIQSDNTILVPGVMTAWDTTVLRAIADQESSGIATVWRVNPDRLAQSILRGAITPEDVITYLESRSLQGPGSIPQGLMYLITDTQRRLSANLVPATVSTRPVLVLAPHSLPFSPLEQDLDDDDVETKTISLVIADIREGNPDATDPAAVDPDATDLATMMSEDAVTLPHEDAASRAPRQSVEEIKALLRKAYTSGQAAHVVYADTEGTQHAVVITVIMVDASRVSGVATDGALLQFHPHRVERVTYPAET